MDKLAKALAKMPEKDRQKILAVLIRIRARDYSNLDFKKLSGRDDIYRVRHGDWRIVFYLFKDNVNILSVEKRSDNTYNF
ncbi:MAG: type II toxin-antitoxin system RelE/ParE family toxin [Candidatus Buchananbacteria bacterium]|jgi:mRNA-degrading endonuclease RelE of RelBE toxin-antitoxin system